MRLLWRKVSHDDPWVLFRRFSKIRCLGYNKELKCFVQSYENKTVVDSAVLIAPLVFFIAPSDPRFLNTLDRMLEPPEKGGLTSTGLVYRYNTDMAEDGKTSPSYNMPEFSGVKKG